MSTAEGPWVPVDPATAAAAGTAVVTTVRADGASTGPGPAGSSPAEERHPADVVRDAVLTARGVVRLSGGALGEVATYLPGRRVAGVRVADDELEVHVVAAYGTPVAETAAAVRSALAGLPASSGLAGRRVDVVVDDVDLPSPVQG